MYSGIYKILICYLLDNDSPRDFMATHPYTIDQSFTHCVEPLDQQLLHAILLCLHDQNLFMYASRQCMEQLPNVDKLYYSEVSCILQFKDDTHVAMQLKHVTLWSVQCPCMLCGSQC